jgi:hypothetical protein
VRPDEEEVVAMGARVGEDAEDGIEGGEIEVVDGLCSSVVTMSLGEAGSVEREAEAVEMVGWVELVAAAVAGGVGEVAPMTNAEPGSVVGARVLLVDWALGLSSA